jgi:hypothetical protein
LFPMRYSHDPLDSKGAYLPATHAGPGYAEIELSSSVTRTVDLRRRPVARGEPDGCDCSVIARSDGGFRYSAGVPFAAVSGCPVAPRRPNRGVHSLEATPLQRE